MSVGGVPRVWWGGDRMMGGVGEAPRSVWWTGAVKVEDDVVGCVFCGQEGEVLLCAQTTRSLVESRRKLAGE